MLRQRKQFAFGELTKVFFCHTWQDSAKLALKRHDFAYAKVKDTSDENISVLEEEQVSTQILAEAPFLDFF